MNYKVGIIGLGYVGLPLAVESGRYFSTVGFDINHRRIDQLKEGIDSTNEVTVEELRNSKELTFAEEIGELRECNFYIVTVPTPVDENNNPDLRPIINATESVVPLLEKGDIVVYESTVFPGCTEEVCVPILETSGLVYNEDFFCGYSPERINPGDKEHRISTILKVTSGSAPKASQYIDAYYSKLVKAGTYMASSIKVAEAAKVIENSQRDINIAFINELALIFDRLEIDTHEVLEAAGTKWNFLPFKPGLVGGHCIGVDPFYLTQKAESVGYHPQMILSGRRINDQMGQFVAQKVIKMLGQKSKLGFESKILIMGFTFKENCPDTRNTKVIDIYDELTEYGLDVDVYDSTADANQVYAEYNLQLVEQFNSNYDAVILAVGHSDFLALDWEKIRKNTHVLYDVKGVLPRELVDGRL